MKIFRTKLPIVALAFASVSAATFLFAAESTIRVKNLSPIFQDSAGVTVLPSDGGVDTLQPLSVGGTVQFTATATDPNGDDWYFAVCKTNDITARDGLSPVCDDGAWAQSGVPVKSGSPVVLPYTVTLFDKGSHDWFAFACDAADIGSECSKANQGDGLSGSPFVVAQKTVALRFGADCPQIAELQNLSSDERESLKKTLDRKGIEKLVDEELKKGDEAVAASEVRLGEGRIKVLKEIEKSGKLGQAQKDAVVDFVENKRKELKKFADTNARFCVVPTSDDSLENVIDAVGKTVSVKNQHQLDRDDLKLDFRNDAERSLAIQFRQKRGASVSALPAAVLAATGPTVEYRDPDTGERTAEIQDQGLSLPRTNPTVSASVTPTIEYKDAQNPNKLAAPEDLTQVAPTPAPAPSIPAQEFPSSPGLLPLPVSAESQATPSPVATASSPVVDVFRSIAIRHEQPLAAPGVMDRMFGRLFGTPDQQFAANEGEFEMRVAKQNGNETVAFRNLSDRKLDFYEYGVGNEIKNYTLYNYGFGQEEELYSIDNAILHLRPDGSIEGYYNEPIDLAGIEGAAGADQGLLDRAARTLAKDRIEDLFLNGGPNPDFIIPAPFAVDRDNNRVTELTTEITGDLHNQIRVGFTVSADQYPITLDPTLLLTAPGMGTADVTVNGETTSNYFGDRIAIGDLNDDGKSDLVVGAYGYSTGTGRVYIFLSNGSISTAAASADYIIQGEAANSSFGTAIAIGDLNNDAHPDLAVGAYQYSAANYTGRTYVFLQDATYSGWGSVACTTGCLAGNADYIIQGETTSNNFGGTIAIGDVNNDAKPDLVVSATGYSTASGRVYIYLQDATLWGTVGCTTACAAANADYIIQGETTSNYFGASITIGDLNNDSLKDIAISANGYSTSTGRVYLFLQDATLWGTSACTTGCSAANADTIIQGEATNNLFGYAIGIGDLNADGANDLVVGASYYSTNTGRAYIFYQDSTLWGTASCTTGCSAANADVIITGTATNDYFAYAFALADFNSDGRTDLSVGSPGYGTNAGRVYIFSNDGSYATAAANANLILNGSSSSQFGHWIDSGDLNADGSADLAVGASALTTNTGAAYVYYGEGREMTSDTIIGEATAHYFGSAMTTGDFNADGKIDLAVSSSGYNSSTGRTYIFYNDGAFSATAAQADVIINGVATSDSFGAALSSGDLNADGKIDLIVIASGVSSSSGRAYLFWNDGSYPTSASNADVFITGESASSYFGTSGGKQGIAIGDLNSDGKADLVIGSWRYSTDTGRAYVFINDGTVNFGSATCSGTPASCSAANADYIIQGEATSNYFASSIAIGDLNSDGKADLAITAWRNSSYVGKAYIFLQDATLWGTASCTTACAAANADYLIAGEGGWFGTTLAIGDLNGDGINDLAVGAGGYSTGNGRVYIFYQDATLWGTASCTTACAAVNADVKIDGEGAGYFGDFQLHIHDMNGDGRTDLVAQANRYLSSNYTGRVYIFYNDGALPTTAATADVILSGEATMGGFGSNFAIDDLNADGSADLAVGANMYPSNTSIGRVYIFYGTGAPVTNFSGTVPGEGTGQAFSHSVILGDFNADGRKDLAVSAPYYSTSTGRVYIFYNDGAFPATAATADVIITGEATSNNFGYYSLAAGDLNADGRTDLVAGSYGHSTNTGRAYIFYNDGSIPTAAGSADVIISGNASGDIFGHTLTTGDLNSDGRIDLVVGAHSYASSTGRAYIFYNDGTIPTTAATADVTITGQGGNFSVGMATGDLNFDGRTDLAVGAIYYTTTGRAYIFYNDGTLPTTAATADVIISGVTTQYFDPYYGWLDNQANFGTSLSIGDLNSDGRADLAIGDYNYGTGAEGRAYIFYNDGSYTNVASSADVIIDGAGGYFGWGSLGIGDLNSDGRNDLVVGAHTYASNTGRAYIFYNDGAYPSTAATADVIFSETSTGQSFGVSMAIGDLNSDGRNDLFLGSHGYPSYSGKFNIYYGQRQYNWETRYPYQPSKYSVDSGNGYRFQMHGSQTAEKFGTSYAVGDFNGDGTRDLAVGAPGYNSNQGRVYIYLNQGSLPSANTDADVIITGAASSEFGTSLAAGKVSETQDAIDDLVIGMPASSGGGIYIFNGRSTWDATYSYSNRSTYTVWSTGYRCGQAVAIGDFGYGSSPDANRRGAPDIAYTCPLYSTTGLTFLIWNDGAYPVSNYDTYSFGPASGSTSYGYALVAGDVDGDGDTDLVVGDQGFSTNTGRVIVMRNDLDNTIAVDYIITGTTSGDKFGASIALGELSNTRDYKVDIAVGAPGYSSSQGRTYVFYNDATLYGTSSCTTACAAANADVFIGGSGQCGTSMAAGDLTHDGRDDLAVGCPTAGSNYGFYYVYNNNGSLGSYYEYNRGDIDEYEGSAMSVGDLTNDGWLDLITSGYTANTNIGRLNLFDFKTVQTTGPSGSKLGSSFAIGDFDGNGKKDLAVGAPGYSTSAGRVYLFLKDFSTTDLTDAFADVTITGFTSAELGAALAAGKVGQTADAIDDVLIGAPGTGGGVYIFDGRQSWNSAYSCSASACAAATSSFAYSNIARCGQSVAVGNFLGDSRVDPAYGCSTYNSTGIAFSDNNDGAYPGVGGFDAYMWGPSSGNFGASMASGDLNSDGVDDLVVGDPTYSSSAGRADVILGPLTANKVSNYGITGEAGSLFGTSVAVGDLNSDGKVDIAVGAPNYSTNLGRTYLFNQDTTPWGVSSCTTSCLASNADTIISGDSSGIYFGQAVTIGDFSNDGRPDLVVGSPVASSNGLFWVYYNDSSYPSNSSSADFYKSGSSSIESLGAAPTLGDLNADGHIDFVLGEIGNTGGGTDSGGFVVLFGQRSTVSPPAITSVTVSDSSGFTADSTPVVNVTPTSSAGLPDYIEFSCDGATWGTPISFALLEGDNEINDSSPSLSDFDILTGAGCSAGDGTKTVYSRLSNGYGYTSYSNTASDSTVYDATAPLLTGFARVGALSPASVSNISAAAIDTAGGYAYFGTNTTPGKIVKVRLSDFTEVGTLTLNTGENGIVSGVLDANSDYGYFSTYTSPGKIVKVRLSDLTRVSAITLSTGNNNPYSAVIDTTAGYAYFGTNTSPGKVVKVDIAYWRTFQEITSLSITGSAPLETARIDSGNTYAYFSDLNWPGEVYKIRLSDFTMVGNAIFNSGEDGAVSAVLDPAGVYAYYGTHTAPSKIVRIRLSDMARIDSVTLSTNENYAYMATVDPTTSMGYFGTNDTFSTATNPGIIVKVNLSTMARVGAVTLSAGEKDLWGDAVMDSSAGYAYFGTSTATGKVIKIGLLGFAANTTSTTQFSLDPIASDGSGSGLHATPYDYRMQAGAACGGASVSGFVATDPYTWSGLTANTQYSFDMRTQDVLTNTSSYSNCTTKYTMAAVPPAPTLSNPTTGGFDWSFSSGSSLGRVVRVNGGSLVNQYIQDDGSASDLENWDAASPAFYNFDANTQYTVQGKGRNNNLIQTAYGSTASIYTAANTPAAPTLNNQTGTTIDVNPVTGGAESSMAIYVEQGAACDGAGGLGYLQFDGSLDVADWQTDAAWGTTAITGLTPNTQYSFCVKARNGDNVETPFGAAASIYTLPVLNSISLVDTDCPTCTGYTNEVNPQINLSITGAAPATMYFSCNGGTNWSTGIAYASPTTAFNITSGATGCTFTDGLKTITARVQSTGGLYSSTASNTITFDGTAPNITGFTVTATSSTQIQLDPAANETGGSGLHATPYDYRSQAGATCGGANATGWIATDPYTWGSLSPNTQYAFDFNVRDILGNAWGTYQMCTARYTFASTPAAPTLSANGTDATYYINVNPVSGGAEASMAIYAEYGSACDGTGGIGWVQAAGPFHQLSGLTVWQSDAVWGTSPVQIGSPNIQVAFCAAARNNNNDETVYGPAAAFYTYAQTPGTPTVDGATYSTLNVAITQGVGNPVGTLSAIRINGGAFTNQYVQANGSVGSNPVFQTKATWETDVGGTRKTVTGLTAGVTYSFDVVSQNGDGVNTNYSNTTNGTTLSAPAFTVAPADGSNSTTPSNVGSNVTFTATATDPQADQWYLAICKTNSVTAGNNAAPTCPGGSWAISSATANGAQATTTYTVQATDTLETYAWYGFACDKYLSGVGACSAMSNAASPFEANHRPSYSGYTATDASGGSIEPGENVKFSVTTADTDTSGVQDTVAVFVCAAGNTFNGSSCSGTQLCTVATTAPGAVTCTTSSSPAPVPTAAGSVNVEVFVVDSHSLVGNGASTQSFTVSNVAPTISASSQYTVSDITLAAGTSVAKNYTVVVTDNNGGSTISSATGVLYDDDAINLASGTCSANEKNCYPGVSCSAGTVSGADRTFTCGFTVWFNANFSDSSGQDWRMHANPTDGTNSPTTLTDSNAIQVGALAAISAIGVSEASIAYGSLSVGNASPTGILTTLQNAGNQILDVLISGTDMTFGSNTIPKAQQKFHETSSTFDWTSGGGFALIASPPSAGTETNGCLNRDMAVRAVHNVATEDESIWWKLMVPSNQASGTYSGSTTIAGATSATCTGTLY